LTIKWASMRRLLLATIILIAVVIGIVLINVLPEAPSSLLESKALYLIILQWRSQTILTITIPKNYLKYSYTIKSIELRYSDLRVEIPLNITMPLPSNKYIRLDIFLPNPEYSQGSSYILTSTTIYEPLYPYCIESMKYFITRIDSSSYNNVFNLLERLINEIYVCRSFVENRTIHVHRNITTLRLNDGYMPEFMSIEIPLSRAYSWVSEHMFTQVIIAYSIDGEVQYNVSTMNAVGVGFKDKKFVSWIKEMALYKTSSKAVHELIEKSLCILPLNNYKALLYFGNVFDKLVFQWIITGKIFMNRTIHVYIVKFPPQ